MLEIAVLGLLNESPMHGYELRKRLSNLLGAFRAFSYGSLYPTLRRLAEAGWISEEESVEPVSAKESRCKRGKRVYRLTAEGKMRNCLFAREETDLLSALRRGEDVSPLIEANVLAKHKMLGGLPQFNPDKQEEVLHDLSSRPMVSIGG